MIIIKQLPCGAYNCTDTGKDASAVLDEHYCVEDFEPCYMDAKCPYKWQNVCHCTHSYSSMSCVMEDIEEQSAARLWDTMGEDL